MFLSCDIVCLRSRFLTEPVEIRLVAGLDWPRHQAWAVVRVQFCYALFDLFDEGGSAFGNQHDFGCRLDRVHAGNDAADRSPPTPVQRQEYPNLSRLLRGEMSTK